MQNGERVKTGVRMFEFPGSKDEKKKWCCLIKRQEGKDNFRISPSTKVCQKHFLPDKIIRTPGGTRVRLDKSARPILHSWNNWTVKDNVRRTSIRHDSAEIPLLESETGHKTEDEIAILKAEIDRLNSVIQLLNTENKELQEKLNLYEEKDKHSEFVHHILKDDETCNHYTGIPTVARLKEIFTYCDPGDMGQNMLMPNYIHSKDSSESRGRKRAFKPFEGYLVTLNKLKRGFSLKHLKYLYGSKKSTVGKTINMWINFLYLRLGVIPIWCDRETLKNHMPESMKNKFPNVRTIIDCSEIFVENPSSLFLSKMFYSDYKSHETLKVLFGIMPGIGFNFISSAYVGSISDREITIKSGILNEALWEKGDAIMADCGFTVQDLFEPLGVNVILPAFLHGREQLTEEENILSQQIAAERIHVERMIERFKNFHIFDSPIPVSLFGSINQIVTICAILANFQQPIIAQK